MTASEYPKPVDMSRKMGETGQPGQRGGDAVGPHGGPGGAGGEGGAGGLPDGPGGPGGGGGAGGPGGVGSGGLPQWVGIVLILFALLSVGQGWYFNNQQRHANQRYQETARCQAKFNQDFVLSLNERSKLSSQDRTQLNTMIFTLVSATSPEVRRKAILDWVAATKAVDAERAKKPLPNLDDRNCG